MLFLKLFSHACYDRLFSLKIIFKTCKKIDKTFFFTCSHLYY